MNRLETIVAGIKSQIGAGIEPALKFLEQQLNPASSRYNDYIQIKGRYNSLQRELLLGIIDQNTYNHWRNSLSNALLLFADELKEADIQTEVNRDNSWDDKRGDILYYIPHQMLLNREERCAVRLAWIEEALLRDWDAQAEDVRKEIRMSDIMAVELLNLDERQPFQIRSLSEAVQFVDNDDYTEWVFYIKPLLEGEFALVLRVSVIEIIRDKEYKKDIVLEERVQVQTQELPQREPGKYKSANTVLAMSDTLLAGNGARAALPAATALPAVQTVQENLPAADHQVAAKSTTQQVFWKWIVAIAATVSVAVAAFWGIKYYQEEQLWTKTEQCGKPKCARVYLDRYPNGRHTAEALRMVSDTFSIQLPEGAVPPVETFPTDAVVTDMDEEGFVILPEDTLPFSLELWRLKQDNPAAQPRGNRKKPPASPNNLKQNAPPLLPGYTPETLKSMDLTSGAIKDAVTTPADPDLAGRVALYKAPQFRIAEQDMALLDLRIFKYNEFEEAVLILSCLGNLEFRKGQKLRFITQEEEMYELEVYRANAKPGNLIVSQAYFRVDKNTLTIFGDKRLAKIQVFEPGSGKTAVYKTTRAGRQDLHRQIKQLLKEINLLANQ